MFQAIILTPKFNFCYYMQSVYATTNPAFPWQQKRSTTQKHPSYKKIRLEFKEEFS
jgi:hypothetical protein